jgi:hypothetical protein
VCIPGSGGSVGVGFCASAPAPVPPAWGVPDCRVTVGVAGFMVLPTLVSAAAPGSVTVARWGLTGRLAT